MSTIPFPRARRVAAATAPSWPDAAHLLAAQRLAALGSWEIDPRRRALRCTPMMLDIVGWERPFPPTLETLRAQIHPDDRDEVEAWLTRLCRARTAPSDCHLRLLRGYEVRTLLARGRPTQTTQGMRLIGTVQDVSEHVRARRASQENALLRRGMFESATWGIFQSTGDGRYLAANPALARIYGYDSPREMVLGMTDIGRQLYVDPARRDAFVRLIKENGTVSGFESEVYRRDGTRIWISECCREVRTGDGRLLFYEGTVEDITARKRSEAELRAAKEVAETANRAKTTFLNNMSHELRTPLNAILGFAEIMGDELFGPLGAAPYADYARDIHASGKRLLDIINDILDVTRIEAGTLALAHDEIALGPLMEDCGPAMAEAAEKQGVTLAIQPPPCPVALRADPVRLRQVVLNLVSNAIKFSPQGRTVTVACTAPDAAGEIALTVADQGIGMTEEEARRALQPFQQIDTSLARRFEGTGLGLTLTQSLVRLHGGRISIESAPGAGTTVTVHLPAAAAAAPVH